jgi:hypothetical protein
MKIFEMFFSRPPSHVSLCGNKIQEMCDNEQNVAERMKILKGETLFTRAKSTSIRIEFYGQFKFFPASKIFHAWLDNDTLRWTTLCVRTMEKEKYLFMHCLKSRKFVCFRLRHIRKRDLRRRLLLWREEGRNMDMKIHIWLCDLALGINIIYVLETRCFSFHFITLCFLVKTGILRAHKFDTFTTQKAADSGKDARRRMGAKRHTFLTS